MWVSHSIGLSVEGGGMRGGDGRSGRSFGRVNLEARARTLLQQAGVAPDAVLVEVTARMRYLGQGYEIVVTVPQDLLDAGDHDRLRQAFDAAYTERYGNLQDSAPEVVSWRVVVRSHPPVLPEPPAPEPTDGGSSRPRPKGRRPVYFAASEGFVETDVHDRSGLQPGHVLTGPVVIEEAESTVVVPPGCEATVDRHRAIVIRIGNDHRPAADETGD